MSKALYRLSISKSSKEVVGSKKQQQDSLPAALEDSPLVAPLKANANITTVRTTAGLLCMPRQTCRMLHLCNLPYLYALLSKQLQLCKHRHQSSYCCPFRAAVLLQICDEPGVVSAALICSPFFGKVVAKATYAARPAGDEMAAAEVAASDILQDCSALLVPADAVGSSKGSGDIVLVSQYAGTSVEQLMEEWQQERMPARVGRAQQLLACMLLGLDELSKLQQPQIYRDFKLGNITYDEDLQLFKLIDFGLMMAADKSDYGFCGTLTHIAPEQAKLLLSSSGQCKDSKQTAATATSPASDVWALFLTALMLVLNRKLPSQLQALSEGLSQQQGDAQKKVFVAAVAAWNPAQCMQLVTLECTEPGMADLFKRGLAADPADRITVQQALQDPALDDAVEQCKQRVEAAAPVVAKQRPAICSLAAAVEAEQPIPATPERVTDCGCRCSGSSSSSSISVLPHVSVAASSSSISSDAGCSTQSQPAAAAEALPAAAKATHAFGLFGGMRWLRLGSSTVSSSVAVSRCSSGKGEYCNDTSAAPSADATVLISCCQQQLTSSIDSGSKAAAAAATRGWFANRVAGKLAACVGSKKSSKGTSSAAAGMMRSRAAACWAEMQQQLSVLAAGQAVVVFW
jgi:serine/threonine protein kinase